MFPNCSGVNLKEDLFWCSLFPFPHPSLPFPHRLCLHCHQALCAHLTPSSSNSCNRLSRNGTGTKDKSQKAGDAIQKAGVGHFSALSDIHYSFYPLLLLPWCLGISALDSHNELFLWSAVQRQNKEMVLPLRSYCGQQQMVMSRQRGSTGKQQDNCETN